MTGIIILNWNGWEDSIECLKSISEINDSEYFIILVDNGSTDNSVSNIEKYLNDESITFYRINSCNTILPNKISNKDVIIYELKDNLGFAKGNNIGLEIAKKYSPEFCLLLNNDTVVLPDFLDKLIEFIRRYPIYSVLTPKICYFSDNNIIWNCGGNIRFGFRKYYYANKDVSEVKESEKIDISFITGCALFFKTSLIKYESLLTERFFHGEEDFDFSLRMKSNNIKMACVLDSVIYHKVGRAIKKTNNLGKIYAHYLNRYINMRLNMSSFKYFLWKNISNLYLIRMFIRQGFSQHDTLNFISRLNSESATLDSVSKDKFFEILKRDI